jgi:hypothetical protein
MWLKNPNGVYLKLEAQRQGPYGPRPTAMVIQLGF